MDMKKLKTNARIVLEISCQARKGEAINIFTDQNERRVEHCRILASEAKEMGLIPVVIDVSEYGTLAAGKQLEQVPPLPSVIKAIENADINLRVGGPSFKYLLHDPLGHENALTGEQRRYFLMDHGLENWDLKEDEVAAIRTRTLGLCELMQQSSEVKVTSPSGTDFSCGLNNDANWLPILLFVPVYGEVALVPESGTSSGVYVIDGPTQRGVRPADELGKEYLKVYVEKGRIIQTEGDPQQLARLQNLLDEADPRADNIDEIGIVTTNMPENDSFWGDGTHQHNSIHIALGNNTEKSTQVHGKCHMDGDLINASVIIDGTEVVKDGVFIDGVM